MDLLSITLAVVTLATALKDIALAQNVEQSFAKVSSLSTTRNINSLLFYFSEFADRAKAISGGSNNVTSTSRIL